MLLNMSPVFHRTRATRQDLFLDRGKDMIRVRGPPLLCRGG